jgi:hypothetical protein
VDNYVEYYKNRANNGMLAGHARREYGRNESLSRKDDAHLISNLE